MQNKKLKEEWIFEQILKMTKKSDRFLRCLSKTDRCHPSCFDGLEELLFLISCLNVFVVLADFNSVGRLFQSFGPIYDGHFSPIFLR